MLMFGLARPKGPTHGKEDQNEAVHGYIDLTIIKHSMVKPAKSA